VAAARSAAIDVHGGASWSALAELHMFSDHNPTNVARPYPANASL
jgi:hypothetical protein